MRLVDDVMVPFSSVKFRIRIDGTQVLLTEVGMESRAVQPPAAPAAGLRLSTTLTMMGAGFVAPFAEHGRRQCVTVAHGAGLRVQRAELGAAG